MKLTVSLEKEGYISKEVSFTFTPLDTNEVSVASLVDLNLTPLKDDLILNDLLGLKTIYYDFDKADLRADAIIELQAKKIKIPITTFMIASDPYLKEFVKEFTQVNNGNAYYSSLKGLGNLIFEDYRRNRTKRF